MKQKSERLFTLELFIAKFLRYGVLLAGVLLFIGWMSQIDFHHNTFEAFSSYREAPLADTLSQIITNRYWGLLIAYLGLGVLISLPLIRVALTAVVFIVDRDYTLALCALLVLAGLLLSFTLGYQI